MLLNKYYMNFFNPFLSLVSVLLLLNSSLSANLTNDMPVSDYYDGKRFHNIIPVMRTYSNKRGKIFKWMFSRKRRSWPKNLPVTLNTNISPRIYTGQGMHITFVNHSTFLIQIDGINILTDPTWSERASPVSWAGPRRARKPGVLFDDLPRIDAVLVSHNHYDHMDIPTLRELNNKFHPRIYTGLKNKSYLNKHGIKNVHEMKWWQSEKLTDKIILYFVPAQHFSARFLDDRNKTLWGGFYISAPSGKIFFAGDTGFGPHFKQIKEKLGKPDVSLLPIGAYKPRWFMKPVHLNPDEAVQAHLILNSRNSIGIHFGTFQLADDRIDDPAKDLKKTLIKYKVSEKKFIVPEFGETMIFNKKRK